MTSRRPLIAGNWKMHNGGADGRSLAEEIAKGSGEVGHVDLVVSPPYTALSAVVAAVASSNVEVAAQNVHQEPKGAYTGEISAEMLLSVGCKWVIVGHSERREYFDEDDELVAKKTQVALNAGLRPIVCIGEKLEEREAGKTIEVVVRQLAPVTKVISSQPGVAAIAYEPVWAIGTGKVATTEQAQEVHAKVREVLGQVSADLSEQTRILYGGSVKPDNAQALLACADIDGALVGGASLKADSFLQIASGAARS